MFLVFLVLVAVWVVGQKDNYDPAERDVSFAALEQDSVADTLYRQPVKRWTESQQQAGGVSSVDLGVFPASVLDDGWHVDGRVEEYDPDNVYEKINGAAEQYLAYGFAELHYLTIAKADNFITIELYDQQRFANALGIFSAQRDSDQDVRKAGPLYYYTTPAGAIGIHGRFYFKVTGNSGATQILSKSQAIVMLLATLPLRSATANVPFDILTQKLGLDFQNVRYQKNNVFQYSFAKDFWFGLAGRQSQESYFIHQADAPEQAVQLYSLIKKEHQAEYDLVDEAGDGAVFLHRYLKTYFSLNRIENVIFGIDGALNRDVMLKYDTRLRQALSSDRQE